MRVNGAKRRLAQGAVVFGSFLFFREPAHVEILGLAGYDFFIADMEHAGLDVGDVERLVRAGEAVGLTSVVRVPGLDPGLIARVLDTGAQGIMLPHLAGPREAARLAEAVRYPPDGIRGACTGVRATGFSATPFDAHVTQTADEVWLLGLIEDASAADQIDKILAEGAIDAVIPGPADLSTSLGLPGQFRHPEVLARVDRVLAAASRSERAVAGAYVADPADAAAWIATGARIIIWSIDSKVLFEAYRGGLERMRLGGRMT